ncbi:GRASP55/65 PDZ-like domain-containing protein [Abortiporus biennis]|nr:GRASP55/65 PDZ-like domain-containing protein [Abortiporus biennis]
MGAGQSSTAQAPSRGLHILRVTPSSPASQTTIEPFFDFVVGFQGDSLDEHKSIDASELEKIVESHEGRPLNLLVWNSKSQQTRVVPIIPSRQWSLPHTRPDPEDPNSEKKPSLLGLSMRMCSPESSLDNVWHVLDVLEGSPAESAGLVPYGDWIIGWSGGVLNSEGDFYDVVESHIEKPLRVYVYSYDFDNIREVVLIPNRHWGGEGLLGCVFGFGLLHRIPPLPEDREPGSIPPELLEPPDEFEEQQLFVPADAAGDLPETPGQAEERMRWEQADWEREHYSRNYHDSAAANQITSSAYTSPHGHGYDAELSGQGFSQHRHHHEHDSEDDDSHSNHQDELEEAIDTLQDIRQVNAPTPVRPVPLRQISSESSTSQPRTPSLPSRSSSFSFRASTPTQNRPFGSLMNGDSLSRP